MENWCYELRALALFATLSNWRSNFSGICKQNQSASFSRRFVTMRQLSFGLLDMG
jgi:Zn-dependent oligopeptidase